MNSTYVSRFSPACLSRSKIMRKLPTQQGEDPFLFTHIIFPFVSCPRACIDDFTGLSLIFRVHAPTTGRRHSQVTAFVQETAVLINLDFGLVGLWSNYARRVVKSV